MPEPAVDGVVAYAGASAGASALLYDLDGTFADTARDMALALNRLLRRHGRPSLPPTAARL